MSLYENSGYLSIPAVLGYGMVYNYIWGGRGTGKTYGALKWMLENKKKFVFLRSRDSQIDALSRPSLSPLTQLNIDMGWDYIVKSMGQGMLGFYHSEKDKKGKLIAKGEAVAIAVALSTIGKLRGFNAPDFDYIIYDEFVPVMGEIILKNAGYLFDSAYETINRNRELAGKEPVRVLMLSNSETAVCDMILSHNLMAKVASMSERGQEVSILDKRLTGLYNLVNSPISQKKKDTALYKMLGIDSEYTAMAIGNKFAGLNNISVKSENLKEYYIVVQYDCMYFYRHKSKDLYYVSTHKSGKCPKFRYGEEAKFKRQYLGIWDAYMWDCILFESIVLKSIYEKMLR